MKKFLAICSIFVLTGCGAGTTAVPQVVQRTELQLPQTPPLALQPVKFQVVETKDGQTVIAIAQQDYVKLSQDMQKIQDKLLEQYAIIQDNLKYYKNNQK